MTVDDEHRYLAKVFNIIDQSILFKKYVNLEFRIIVSVDKFFSIFRFSGQYVYLYGVSSFIVLLKPTSSELQSETTTLFIA